MNGAINWFSRNHVAANFLMLIVVVLGLQTWGKLKKEIFPETSIDMISIQVPYPNATPEEVEKGIIVPIEEAIQDVDGVDRIRSTAAQSIGSVLVEVVSGYETRNVMDDVKSRVDAIQNIAEEAEEPILEELLIKAQVMAIAVSADTDEKTLRNITERIRTGLLTYKQGPIPVTQVELAGVRDYEISIEISEQTLREYGLTFADVASAVRRSSLDLPGGSVRTVGGEVMIRTESRRYTAEEFAPITVVTRADGSKVQLSDIALIRDAFEEKDIDTYFDGRPAMLLNVYRVGNEDTLELAETAKQFVYDYAPSILPDGVKLEVWKDDSLYLKGRLDLLARNGIGGLILVGLVLALFLRPSIAFLVAIGIPVSFAGAIWMMPYTGISINMISLFAFILVLGIVVDDAIVVGENVYSRMRKGEHPKIAAPKGTHEVGIVVIFGVLTTAMAFTPMLGLTGVSGKIWPNIPLIVIPTLMFSLVQSKLILPAHLSLLKPYDPNEKLGPIMRFQHFFSRGLETFVERSYRPTIKFCLNYRYQVGAAFIALLFCAGSLIGTGRIKFQFFPEVETDVVTARLQLSRGVSYGQTQVAVKQIQEAAFKLNDEFKDKDGNPIIRHMLASAGSQPLVMGFGNGGGVPKDSNLGEVTLELQPAKNRTMTATDIVSRWRELTGPIPGTVELIFMAEAAAGGNAIDLELVGPDLKSIDAAAAEVQEQLRKFDGVIDIADNNIQGKRELKLEILPQAEALGLRLDDLARQLRQGFYGEEIQRLQRGRNEVKVFVRYPRDERSSLSDVERSKIRLPDGTEVPFTEVGRATFARSPSSIQRTDQQRAIRVTADVDKAKGTNATEVVTALTGKEQKPGFKERLAKRYPMFSFLVKKEEPGKEGALAEEAIVTLTEIEKKYPGVGYSFEGEQKDQAQSISEMGSKFIIALLAMYVLMAIPLKSYFQPMIIMSVIPFGLVGALVGHILMNFNFSIMSMCGFVALAGVVVNDSLVLVDYVNRYVKAGHTVLEAAREAGAARFRPILLTSLTTFAGLTPMLLETDIQARFLIPMAVSLSFGILFSTAIVLILVPCIYLMMEDLKAAILQRKERRQSRKIPPLPGDAKATIG
ncbi:efflux RND transporter permease subunit [Verrucomicrobiales bacterium]|nr:efflux RND transporter permease subunit [Verrucomicrobiales bacterium]